MVLLAGSHEHSFTVGGLTYVAASNHNTSANSGNGTHNMGHYEVRIVEDGDLPSHTPWAIARVEEGAYLFVKRSEITSPERAAELVSDAWVCWEASGGGGGRGTKPREESAFARDTPGGYTTVPELATPLKPILSLVAESA